MNIYLDENTFSTYNLKLIVVPGVVGSQVEGKWNTTRHPEGCEESSLYWKQLWFRLDILAGGDSLKCWVLFFVQSCSNINITILIVKMCRYIKGNIYYFYWKLRCFKLL